MDESIRALAHELLESGITTLTEKDRKLIARIATKHHMTRNLNLALAQQATLGERIADGVARWGGSWAFIGSFFLFLAAWTVLNLAVLAEGQRFDPYPFIFLNLILSMLAAIQAPIIMMSQNRQAERDRQAATMDYEINLKAEMEIQDLAAKIDRLIAAQAKA